MLLRQLQTFQEAADCGNLSDAARKLHLTQSAVSHQIKGFEQLMGIKVYLRHRRGIVLTDQGKEVLRHVNRIMAHVRDLEESLNAMRGGFTGAISIAAHRGVIKYKIPKVVKLFKKSYPFINIRLTNKFVDHEILTLVSNGTADFGVVTSWTDHGELEYWEFLTYDMFLCVQKGHPLAKTKKKLTLEQVGKEPLLLYESSASIRKGINKTFEKNGVTCEPVVETGGGAILQEYAKAGLGAALISGMSLETGEDSELAAINVSHLFGKLGYGFVYRKDKFFTDALLDFINLLDPQFVLTEKIS